MNTIVMDVDGTLACADHRMHLLKADPTSFDKFCSSEELAKDTPVPGALEGLRHLRRLPGYKIVFLTGRREDSRQTTTSWLEQHMERQPTEPILMRIRPLHHVPASDYKQIMVERHLGAGPLIFFDDDEYVLQKFRRNNHLAFKAPEVWATVSITQTLPPEPYFKY